MEGFKDIDILGLYLIPGLGSGSIRQLVARFSCAEELYRCGLEELSRVEGISIGLARRIKAREYVTDPEREYQRVRQLKGRILTFWDQEFPRYLKEIKYPPVLLYVLGKPIFHLMPLVAVIGSRHPSQYGERVARNLAHGLAKNGLGIVSGLAMGIDSSAHEGALSAGGFTLGVLGTGIDRIYPRSNRALWERMVEHGCIISEFPLGTPPDPKNFPIRNRIISGISMGVVVVEATRSSGSLITAAMALDENREVFAVPGSIESMKSTGCHYLIKQGARLVEKVEDIITELGLAVKTPSVPIEEDKQVIPTGLGSEEESILKTLGDQTKHLDEISRELDMEPGALGALLIGMELRGIIRQLPGKLFVRSI